MSTVDMIVELADLFGVQLSENQFAWYVMALSDLSEDDVRQAMKQAMLVCKFMPRPAELREFAGANRTLNTADMATLAWEAVKRAIRAVGYDQSVAFEDSVINATIRDLGGWMAICDTTSDEMKWLEKRFLATYSALSKCRLPSEATARLPGFAETMNQRNGFGQHPIPVASVPSLTCTKTGQIVRRMAVRDVDAKRLPGPPVPAAKLAERLSFDDVPPTESAEVVEVRDAAEQLRLLRARFGKGKAIKVQFDAEKLAGDVALVQRAEEKSTEDQELRRIMSAPLSEGT